MKLIELNKYLIFFEKKKFLYRSDIIDYKHRYNQYSFKNKLIHRVIFTLKFNHVEIKMIK